MLESARKKILPLARRGVYHLPWVGPDGERFVAAVTRAGRLLYQATVHDKENIRATEVALWQILDRDDPLPLRILP